MRDPIIRIRRSSHKPSTFREFHGNPVQLWNGPSQKCGARVFIKPGKGKIVVMTSRLMSFFRARTGRMVVRQPLVLTNHLDTFDILINVDGGGESGQAGAVRPRYFRALVDYDASLKPILSKAGSLPGTREKSSARKWVCTRLDGRKQFSKR
jgi:small subunit ribosomal protein S9